MRHYVILHLINVVMGTINLPKTRVSCIAGVETRILGAIKHTFLGKCTVALYQNKDP